MIRLVFIFALIAGVGIAVSSLAARRAYEQEVVLERAALGHAIDEHARQIRDRLADRELLARVAVGLIRVPSTLQPNVLAPLRTAINAFQGDFIAASWIAHVDPPDVAEIKPLLSTSGFAAIDFRNSDGSIIPDGYVPSAAINVPMDVEPRVAANLDTIGRVLDPASGLGPALARAVESRGQTCSDPIALPQYDKTLDDKTLALVLVTPVFESGSGKLRGFVGFSYRLESLMLPHDEASLFNVVLRDPRGTGIEFVGDHAKEASRSGGVPVQSLHTVEFGGRQWTLGYMAKRDPTARAFSLAMVVATIGFALTSVICGLFGYVAFNNLRLSREIVARVSYEDRLSAVIGELNHRVKNILAVIQSIVTRTLRDGADVHHARETLIGRIHAMSHVVSLLSDSDWQGVKLRSLLESSVSPGLRQVSSSGPDMTVSPRAAQSLALLFFELASAALRSPDPENRRTITLCWDKDGEGPNARFTLRWEELNSTRERSGGEDEFGDILLNRVVPEALGGAARSYFSETSYVYELQASLPTVVDQSEMDRMSRLSAMPPRKRD